MKFPLLRGWMLHLLAQSEIGFTTALVILVRTLRTIASAVRALICLSIWGSACPPERRIVTSVVTLPRLILVSRVYLCFVTYHVYNRTAPTGLIFLFGTISDLAAISILSSYSPYFCFQPDT
jgi:hypothetical protein